MIVCLSIHADDACFSVGEYLARTSIEESVLVVTLCGGVPRDASEEDRHWQSVLNVEGDKAYEHLGANHAVHAAIFDGKWSAQSQATRASEIMGAFRRLAKRDVSAFLVPMGIHHPDHVGMSPPLLNYALTMTKAKVAIYEDLPYRAMYPEETAILRNAMTSRFGHHMESASNAGFLTRKLEACSMFESQWSPPEGDAPRCCSVPERIWWAR